MATQVVSKWKRSVEQQTTKLNQQQPHQHSGRASSLTNAPLLSPTNKHQKIHQKDHQNIPSSSKISETTHPKKLSSSSDQSLTADSSKPPTVQSHPDQNKMGTNKSASKKTTVKAKISKPRLTGLEGSTDESPSVLPTSQAKVNATSKISGTDTASSSSIRPRKLSLGAAGIAGKGTSAQTPVLDMPSRESAARIPTQPPSTSPTDISPLSRIISQSKVPTQFPKRKPVNVMLSDNFMDALMGGEESSPPKKPKIVRKKLAQQQQQTSNQADATSATAEDSSTIAEDKNSSGKPRRRVHFADDSGQELVQIQLFEIEEGERVNVSKMSSEDMKHMEAMSERKLLEEKGSSLFHHRSAITTLPMPPTHHPQQSISGGGVSFWGARQTAQSHGPTLLIGSSGGKPWNLRPIDDLAPLIVPGSKSQAKEMEFKRQATTMEVFYSASDSLPITDLEDSEWQRQRAEGVGHRTKIIPIEPVVESVGQVEKDQNEIESGDSNFAGENDDDNRAGLTSSTEKEKDGKRGENAPNLENHHFSSLKNIIRNKSLAGKDSSILILDEKEEEDEEVKFNDDFLDSPPVEENSASLSQQNSLDSKAKLDDDMKNEESSEEVESSPDSPEDVDIRDFLPIRSVDSILQHEEKKTDIKEAVKNSPGQSKNNSSQDSPSQRKDVTPTTIKIDSINIQSIMSSLKGANFMSSLKGDSLSNLLQKVKSITETTPPSDKSPSFPGQAVQHISIQNQQKDDAVADEKSPIPGFSDVSVPVIPTAHPADSQMQKRTAASYFSLSGQPDPATPTSSASTAVPEPAPVTTEPASSPSTPPKIPFTPTQQQQQGMFPPSTPFLPFPPPPGFFPPPPFCFDPRGMIRFPPNFFMGPPPRFPTTHGSGGSGSGGSFPPIPAQFVGRPPFFGGGPPMPASNTATTPTSGEECNTTTTTSPTGGVGAATASMTSPSTPASSSTTITETTKPSSSGPNNSGCGSGCFGFTIPSTTAPTSVTTGPQWGSNTPRGGAGVPVGIPPIPHHLQQRQQEGGGSLGGPIIRFSPASQMMHYQLSQQRLPPPGLVQPIPLNMTVSNNNNSAESSSSLERFENEGPSSKNQQQQKPSGSGQQRDSSEEPPPGLEPQTDENSEKQQRRPAQIHFDQQQGGMGMMGMQGSGGPFAGGTQQQMAGGRPPYGTKLCAFFMNTGSCKFGDNCKFSHADGQSSGPHRGGQFGGNGGGFHGGKGRGGGGFHHSGGFDERSGGRARRFIPTGGISPIRGNPRDYKQGGRRHRRSRSRSSSRRRSRSLTYSRSPSPSRGAQQQQQQRRFRAGVGQTNNNNNGSGGVRDRSPIRSGSRHHSRRNADGSAGAGGGFSGRRNRNSFLRNNEKNDANESRSPIRRSGERGGGNGLRGGRRDSYSSDGGEEGNSSNKSSTSSSEGGDSGRRRRSHQRSTRWGRPRSDRRRSSSSSSTRSNHSRKSSTSSTSSSSSSYSNSKAATADNNAPTGSKEAIAATSGNSNNNSSKRGMDKEMLS